jgi:hypothetical protein
MSITHESGTVFEQGYHRISEITHHKHQEMLLLIIQIHVGILIPQFATFTRRAHHFQRTCNKKFICSEKLVRGHEQ